MRLIDADELIRKIRGKKIMSATAKVMMLDAVEESPTVSGWISVKDRLPDTYKAVITYDKYSGVKENWLLKSKPCVSWSQGFHVTHWMPLPEPPKDGDGDA